MSLMLVGSASCANTAQADEPGNGPHKKTHTIAWSQEAFDEAGIKPGDIVVIRSGTYRDLPVKIDIDATAGRPVLIRAEKPGSVVLTGMSSLSIGGSDITVSGLYFKDCDVAAGDAVFNFRTSAKKHAVRSRLDDCIFSGSGLAENKDKDIKWVSVYGHDNEVTRCSFIDKKILGSLLVVWIDPQVIPNHRIRGNYFTHPFSLQKNGSAINGQEMIRIGTSAVSMSEGRCEICDNYFFRCNGEVEIISNKSCANTYRNNVFDSCEGTLTLRHGNDCTVDGNYFFGRGAPNTGGVRIIGERHRVFNNYFEGLAGNSQRSAISLVRGVENSELFEYFQVKDAQVAFNTIVNCKSGITANIGNSASTMPVTDSRVTGNLIVNNAAGTPPRRRHGNHRIRSRDRMGSQSFPRRDSLRSHGRRSRRHGAFRPDPRRRALSAARGQGGPLRQNPGVRLRRHGHPGHRAPTGQNARRKRIRRRVHPHHALPGDHRSNMATNFIV